MSSVDSISGCLGLISASRKSAEQSDGEIFALHTFEQNCFNVSDNFLQLQKEERKYSICNGPFEHS